MSEIGDKIRQVFRESAVYKDPTNNEVFVGRNLPSFVKDYLIATHIDQNGKLRRDTLVRFLNEHIPLNPNAIRSRLMQGDVITLLTRFEISTNIAKNKTQFQIPEMGIKMADTEIPQHVVDRNPDDLIDGEKWGIIKLVYIPPQDKEKGYIEMSKYKPFRPLSESAVRNLQSMNGLMCLFRLWSTLHQPFLAKLKNWSFWLVCCRSSSLV